MPKNAPSRRRPPRACAQGFVLYDGPSLLTGGHIVVIATGFQNPSKNTKTGPMIQVWILVADELPTDAIKSGADEHVCGDCPLRGNVCYVELGRAPYQIWLTHQNGGYPPCPDFSVFAGASVRFGAYGDPAAVPISIWHQVSLACRGEITGYTHQWRRAHPDLKQYCMASTEDPLGRLAAKAQGWRVFRVKEEDEPKLKGEAVCPASEEAGHKLQCIDCMACGGTHAGRRGDVVITVHGSRKATNSYGRLKAAPAAASNHP